MITADVKTNTQNNKIKEVEGVSYKFLYEVPSKLEIQCKNGMQYQYSLKFGWYFIQLIACFVGVGGGYLK